MKEFSIADPANQDEKMSTEIKYKPNWRAKLIWVGEKPTEKMIGEVASDKLKKTKEDPADLTKDCTYLAGRIEKILDENQGIITCRSGRILFHIENFSVDGEHFTTQDNLLNLLEPGEQLFCYAKPLSLPNKITGVDITYEAASVWKGSRLSKNRPSNIDSEEKENPKFPIPVPSEATHKNIVGVVESIENFAYAVIKSEDPSLRGQKVLVTKRRMYFNGSKGKGRTLSECLNIGDEIMLDLVRANPHRSLRSYNWIAVLAWVGETPDRSQIDDEISKKTESYRAKIVLFSDVKNQTCTDGIAQIIGGPGWLGERVLFNRNKTYIFGSSMKKADFSLILKVNDKIQCEIEELSHPVTKNNVEIKLVATLAWVGPPPKLDECTDDIPAFVNGIVDSFIAKRGLTLTSYRQLIRGELMPKSGKAPVVASGAKNAPSPPNITQGRVVELKRPEHGSTTGAEHGIVKIDKGPHAQEKAFFNRSCLSCWGYNCFKADLMFLINETDILMLEVQDGTNNKAVPFKVTAAWIGPHPNEKNKESMAMAGNPVFVKWLKDHSLTIDEFHKVIKGELRPKLFFPLSNLDTLHQECILPIILYS